MKLLERMMSKEKKKVMIQLQVEKEFRDKVELAANSQNVSMSEWIRRAIEVCLPKAASGGDSACAVDRAFDAMDAEEASGLSFKEGILPMPPASSVPVSASSSIEPQKKIEQANQPSVSIVSNHPCIHLVPSGSAMFGQGHGTCSVRGNMECRWPSNIARQCHSFHPIRVRS